MNANLTRLVAGDTVDEYDGQFDLDSRLNDLIILFHQNMYDDGWVNEDIAALLVKYDHDWMFLLSEHGYINQLEAIGFM